MSHITYAPPHSPSVFQLIVLIFIVSSLTQLFWRGVGAIIVFAG